MGKMSILEVPSAALGTGSSDCAPTSAVSRDKSRDALRSGYDLWRVGRKHPDKVARMGVLLAISASLRTEAGKCEFSRRPFTARKQPK